MRRDYTKLEENSADGSNPDLQINPRMQNEFLRPRARNSKAGSESHHAVQQSNKMKDMKSIYLDGKVPDKKHSQKTENNKVNADQLIKVLQNGRERRNLRKKNEQFKNQDSIELRNHFGGGDKETMQTMQKSNFRSQSFFPAKESKISERKTFDAPENELKIKKVLRQMKIEEERASKIKQEAQWKQIESLLSNKSQVESPLNERERKRRKQQLQVAKELLTGKVSIIWIFVLSGAIEQDDKKRILKMYSGLSQTPYIVPLCKRADEIKTFLQVPNSLFKIVADIPNFSEALSCRINNKVVQFYVYNNLGQKGIARALSFKSESRKVKGIYNSLNKIIDRAEDEIQNEIQLFQTKNGISKKNNFKKFPSFIKLSGEDKTYATLYRANLYGAKNVLKEELKNYYNEFMSLVKEKYGTIEKEVKNIQDYQSLNHFPKQFTQKQAKQVLQFYVRQSFYYQILNSMLRTMKTTQQFRPCIFPFYQNYHAVKKFYTSYLQENKRVIKPQTLYRGARLRQRDFNSMKPGVFIQMLGFMSTSKNLERAKQFCDRDGYIFIINVPALVIPQKFNKYDHGFVDINKYGLASKEFSVEQEVLFNVLNVFKITKIQKDGARHLIYMEYGPIFELLSKQKQLLTNDERDVLMNYQYCAHMLDEIEDQGDVLLLANEYDQSKEYYKQKLKQKSQEGKYYYKLANVQQQCGELDEANKNVQISLKLQLENLDLNDREKCLKVFSIHSKNAEIKLDQEDYLNADQAITNAIEMLGEQNQFEKGKKFRERGYVKFKKGQIIDAEKDFQLSERIFRDLTNKAEEKKKSINRGYVFSFLSLICSSTTQEDLEEERQAKLKQIAEIEKEIRNMEELINEELIKVNTSLKEVAHYAQDKQKYEICVKKARAYLFQVKSRETNDPMEKAKLKALQATIQDYLDLAESQRLLYEAIALVQSSEPFNPSVGKYSEILGNLQKKELEKFSNPKILLQTRLQKGVQIKYDKEAHDQIYNKCKKNFEKAINVLLYNNKTKSSPEVASLKNQLGQLDFYESKFEQSYQIIKEVKEASKNEAVQHSEVAKSSLLLSKISYARGELKGSFQNVQQSFQILRNAIVKKQEPNYIAIFQSNNMLLEIKLHKSKIYLKQIKHDLSLRELKQMKQIIDKKTDKRDTHSLLADIYEVSAENKIAKEGIFQDQFQKALKLREKQFGQYNLANAVTYCNYSKYLILTNELSEAQKMLHQATQIFSCFSQQHPITWLVLYSAGLLHQRKQQNQDALKYIKTSLLKVKQKYDKDHITVNKIRLQYAKALQKAGKFEESIKQLEALENDLEDEIRASQARLQIVNERDDQKITVKRFLYQSLRESYQQLNRIDVTNLHQTSVGMNRCQMKMSQLKMSFKFDIKQKDG